MIYYLNGIAEDILDDAIIINVNGIGYMVRSSTKTLSNIHKNKDIKLYTNMIVNEKDIQLIGFLSSQDLEMFNMLTSVSGVGTKAALNIQASLTNSEIIMAVLTGDAGILAKAQGVGKKIASRITLELESKLKNHKIFESTISPQQNLNLGQASSVKQEAIDALLTLGYNKAEAIRAVMEVTLENMNTEQIIRTALKKLSKT